MHWFSYYDDLFRKLHVPQPGRVTELLVTEEPEFSKKYAYLIKPRQYQIGSGVTNKIKFKYDNFEFVIYEIDESDRITYSLFNNNDLNDSRECITLFIPLNEKFVHLQNISYYDKCTSGMPKTRGGSLLLNMTLDFIKKYLKPKYARKYIQLKDNSYFPCRQTKNTIDFDSLYMMSHGHTWYGKYGFVPFDTNTESTDVYTLNDYKSNQKLVEKTKVKDTKTEKYFREAVKILKLERIFTENKLNNMFSAYKELPIKKFVKDLLKQYDVTCGIFSLIYRKMMDDIGMKNLHGRSYYKTI